MMTNELYHHGIKGQKWGVRRFETASGHLTSAGKKRYADIPEPSGKTFKASNGVKVGAAKNGAVKAMRKVVANRAVEKANVASYKTNMKTRHANTDSNNLAIEKGVQRIKKESAALREYNAHQKDLKKGTGDKYLKKEVRKNKIDNAFEKIQSDSSRKDRFIYNDATRKKAAKYVVDKNMTIAEANKKAKSDAWRNTAIFVAGYGAVTLASLHAMK